MADDLAEDLKNVEIAVKSLYTEAKKHPQVAGNEDAINALKDKVVNVRKLITVSMRSGIEGETAKPIIRSCIALEEALTTNVVKDSAEFVSFFKDQVGNKIITMFNNLKQPTSGLAK